MLKYIILEAEIETNNTIKAILDGFDNFQFSGNYYDYDTSLNAILKESPHLVFVDVDSLFENIFEFVYEINKYCENPPSLIGLSLTKNKAYDLLKNNFLDLLLKPLSELDIRKSVLNYLKRNPIEYNEKLCLKSYGDYQYLDIDKIVYLKADNNTTDFYMLDGSTIGAFKTLKSYEDILPESFFRIHRSYIINSKFISRIHYGKSLCTISIRGIKLPFTKTFVKNVDLLNDRLSIASYSFLN